MNNLPVSAKVLEAAIAWKLCLEGGDGTADQRVGKLGGGLAGMLLLGGLLAWSAAPSLAPSYWLADQRTGTGELPTLFRSTRRWTSTLPANNG